MPPSMRSPSLPSGSSSPPIPVWAVVPPHRLDGGRVACLERASEIPCLPVEAFKWGDVRTAGTEEERADPVCFRTSGTTSDTNLRGVHTVRTPNLYRLSARSGFERVHGPPSEDGAVVLGLLPGYLERSDSSLVHMVEDLREAGWALRGESPAAGFHLHDVEGLFQPSTAPWRKAANRS